MDDDVRMLNQASSIEDKIEEITKWLEVLKTEVKEREEARDDRSGDRGREWWCTGCQSSGSRAGARRFPRPPRQPLLHASGISAPPPALLSHGSSHLPSFVRALENPYLYG